MARSDQLRSEIARLESAGAGHQKELAKYQKKADDASAKARSEHSRAEDQERRNAALGTQRGPPQRKGSVGRAEEGW